MNTKNLKLPLRLALSFGLFAGAQLICAGSPNATMFPVPLKDVQLTEGFWAERQQVNNEASLKNLWDRANDPEAGHVIQNFEIAAGRRTGEFGGTDWQDAWLYKWIEAACYIMANDPDARFEGQRLDKLVDEMIELIGDAQEDDGYLATQVTTRADLDRWTAHKHHELYTMGHMLTAACVHYRVTGKSNFLKIAEKCADFVNGFFPANQKDYRTFPNNPSILMGLVDLYRVTGKQRYLDLANHFIDSRGKYPPTREEKQAAQKLPFHIASYASSQGLINNQNFVPLRKSKEVLGHAVFFTYLYAGAADAYLETGDKSLWDALDRHWHDLTEKKMFVTGGVSPHHMQLPTISFKDGVRSHLKGDFVNEGVAKPYDLPQAHGYNETCGMVGNMMWNWRMLQASGEERFADIMELEWHNAILGGVDLDGVGWSYANPLRWHAHDHEVVQEQKYTSERGLPGPKLICCPTNVLRNLSAYAGFLYGVDADTLWIHHYAGSELDTLLADGSPVKLTQQTEFPWDGKVLLMLQSSGNFTIKLRIPYWADGASIKVNGKRADGAVPGEYAEVSRKWKKGDTIELNLPMEVKLLVSDPMIEQTRGQVAVKRGPVVYCLESHDIPKGVNIQDVQIPSDAVWKAEFREDQLDGVTVLKTRAEVVQAQGRELGTIRELGDVKVSQVDIEMIPYFAWHNRGECKMTVWMPLSIK
ncbi:MAG: glycoside hydrolase family 127 protein [Puniceicoccaceae bacterium]